jgi:Flp pilus assembly protein TadG
MNVRRSLLRHLRRAALARLRRDTRGLAAIEFALIASFLAMAVLNVTDISIFLYDRLQVNNATQAGAQAAWQACDLNHLPASTRCPAMAAAVTAAVQSSSLGNAVQLKSGYPSDAYYCVRTSGGTGLQYVGDSSFTPTDCSAAGNAGATPAEYVQIQTTYTYAPIFPGLSIVSVLPATITSTAWVRLH